MQVQCKACKSILNISAVNDSHPPVQIRCRCGAMVSGAPDTAGASEEPRPEAQTSTPSRTEEPRPEAQTSTPSRTVVTSKPSKSSTVTYAFGAVPPSNQKQAGQASSFHAAETSSASAVETSVPTSQAAALRLSDVEPQAPTLGSGSGQSTAAAQPFVFRLVDSQPVESKEALALKQEEAPAIRFAVSADEPELAVGASVAAAVVSSPAPQKKPVRGNTSTASVAPASSARMQSSKRRPGAWRQCVEHPQVKSETMCPTCAVGYCHECKKSICPTCDSPCIEASGYQKWLEQQRIRSRPMMEEIKTILAYPLQDPMAFIIFALITGFFKFAALFSHRVLIFSTGILLWYSFHTLYQVASGNMKRLLPEFNDMSDLTQPMRLSFAALAITWGPALLVGLLFAANAESTGMDVGSMVAGATGVPSETIAPPVNVDEQVKKKVQSLLGGVGREDTESEEASAKEDTPREHITEEDKPKAPVITPSASPLTSAIPLDPKTAGSGLSLLLFVALFWKTAYTPVALIVAALSKNLWSVVNPLIGLDTIRRMGVVYWHVMIIYTGLTAVEWGFGKMFDLFPLVGLAGMAFVRAYFALAVGCALGLAVYKKAPELGWD